MPFEFAKPAGSRRGLGVLAALLLATAALAGLSIQSVYREAQVRKQFIADTNRSIADLVTARLDAAMADADRSVAAAFESIEHHTPGLLRKIHEVESVQPWLAPLVVISAPLSVSNHVSPAPHFQDLMAAAERAEFQANAPLEASRLYATAFSEAANSTERATALNGQARSELKAGDQARAEQSYSKLAEEADTLDREQLRLAVIAKERLIGAWRPPQAQPNAYVFPRQSSISNSTPCSKASSDIR
jgi:hypothetical protein